MYFTYLYSSPLGEITLASDGERITGLWFAGQKYFAQGLTGEQIQRELTIFRRTAAWLDSYFAGENPGSIPPLFLTGSPFRLAVWEILQQIPYGRTITYGEVSRQAAARLGRKTMSAQAVGGAVGHNPVSILVPCHRVVGSSGSLTGYAGGIEKKLALLKLEKADITRLFVPKRGTAL